MREEACTLITTIESKVGNKLKQSVVVTEYSDTVEEHAVKNFEVVGGVTGAMTDLAEAAGLPTSIEAIKGLIRGL